MSNFGIKLAYSGIAVGLLLFAGLPFTGALGPTGGAVYFGVFIFCYVGLPIIGITYDLESGDFEDREGYQP
jgi:hypothetical protein